MKIPLSLLCCIFFLFLSCENEKSRNLEKTSVSGATKNSRIGGTINSYVSHIMDRHHIPGVALAIVKNGEVIHKKNYGYVNLEYLVPVSDSSIFRVYSLTKPIVAVGIFQLIEQDLLSLEDPISRYVQDIPVSWKNVQIKHLLTHSSGLPDMSPFITFEKLTEDEAKERVFDEPIRFSPGEKYEYNQTGFWLLQKIIEKITSKQLDDFIIEYQFDKAKDQKSVFFSSDSRDIVENRATPYFPFRNGKFMIDLSFAGGYRHSANGLNIALHEFVNWDRKFKNNLLISEESKDAMWDTFKYRASNRRFAYGWEPYKVNNHNSFGFSGSMVTAYRVFPEDNMSIIFLSNGLEYWYNIENIVNHIASMVDEDITIPSNFIFESLLQANLKEDFKDFEQLYLKLKNDEQNASIDFENQLNNVAYMLLNLKKQEKALEVFRFNSKEHPDSWNVWDSLGEGYEILGDTTNAIVNYKKSVEINPKNTHGLEKLEKLLEK